MNEAERRERTYAPETQRRLAIVAHHIIAERSGRVPPPLPAPKHDSVELFLAAHSATVGSMSEFERHKAYCDWCLERSLQPLTLGAFHDRLLQIVREHERRQAEAAA